MSLSLWLVALVVIVVVSLSGGVSCGVRPKHYELSGYTFERYVDDFGKGHVLGTDEYGQRKKLFEAELAAVRAHNEAPGTTYKKGVNQYSDWTVAEKRRLRGVLPGGRGAGEVQGGTPYVGRGLPLPHSVDYRTAQPPVLTAVKDQGMCGSCWALSVTESVESYTALMTGELYDLSPEQVTACTPHGFFSGGCRGLFPANGFQYLIDHKAVLQEWQYPYESYGGNVPKCRDKKFTTSATRVVSYNKPQPNNATVMLEALAHIGPLTVAVDASDWVNYESGVYDRCSRKSSLQLDHAVQAVGYGVDKTSGTPYWLIRNSWAPIWGEAGYIRLRRFPAHEPCVKTDLGVGCGECAVLVQPMFPTITHA